MQGFSGNAGSGVRSEAWVMDAAGPTVAAMERLANAARSTVVPSLDITFSEAIDVATFDYRDITLTRNGGTNNLISDAVAISLIASNQYRIEGLASSTEVPGNYLLTIDAAGVEDLAGNGGAAILVNSWQRLGTNTAPQLAPIANPSVQEKNLLSLTVSAADADVPANLLRFSLDADAPSGAAIEPLTGRFTWTPTEEQGPGFASVTVRVTDNGVPPLSAARTFSVTVDEVNEPPALAGMANQTAYVGIPLEVSSLATDPDLPANQLTFTLGAGAPAGARIHPTSGMFTWSPPLAAAGTTNLITVMATDNGNPPFTDARPFTVVVGDFLDLALGSTTVQAGQDGSVSVRIAGNVSPGDLTFALEASAARLTNLSLQNPGPKTGALSLESAGGDVYLLRISALPGQVLSSLQPLADLQFIAVPGQASGFVPLRLADLNAYDSEGGLVARTLTHAGRVAVVGAAPLLEALLLTNDGRTIVLHGTPGKNYAVESAATAVSPLWTTFDRALLTNQFHQFNALPTNRTLFYRAREE